MTERNGPAFDAVFGERCVQTLVYQVFYRFQYTVQQYMFPLSGGYIAQIKVEFVDGQYFVGARQPVEQPIKGWQQAVITEAFGLLLPAQSSIGRYAAQPEFDGCFTNIVGHLYVFRIDSMSFIILVFSSVFRALLSQPLRS